MKSKFFFAAIATFVAAFTLQAQTKPRIWRVNNNPIYIAGDIPGTLCDHCFDNLQNAINSTNVFPGDTLHLEASPTPYGSGLNQTGDITVNKQLIILGPGYFLNENHELQHNLSTATTKTIILELGSSGTVLKGLSLADGGGSAFDLIIKESNVSIERCFINYRMRFENSGMLNNVSIRQNYVKGATTSAALSFLTNSGPVNGLVIMNNYFGGLVSLKDSYQGTVAQNVFDNGVDGYGNNMSYYNNIVKGGTFVQHNNSVGNVYKNIFHNTPAWLDVPNPNNYFNVVMDNIFPTTGSTDGNLDPLPPPFCIPCPNGTNNHEIGMFGGNDPYRLSGVPDIPAIYFLWPEVNLIQSGNLPITIKTRTNN